MTKAVWSAGARVAVATALLGSASCGELTRQGTSPAYLVIGALEGASGADPTTFGTTVASDVITVKDDIPTFFSDPGKVTFSLGLKDPGPAAAPETPSQNNFITVNRLHVRYIRSDGHNIEGVDIPYAFDDAFTVTVSGSTTAGFTLVRNQAKQEAPLKALQVNPIAVSTIAEVTFYGHDQTGREVSVSGNIGVTFANFGDPK